MRRLVAGLVLAAVAAVGAEARPVGLLKEQPFVYIRTLQSLQARVALGSASAQRLQIRLLGHIAQRFTEMPLSVWTSPKNAGSAVIFVLSGGQPDTVRHLGADGLLPTPYDRLLNGALAYVDGRREEAIKLLQGVDDSVLPDAVAGHLALIKSVLVRNSDVKQARASLDRARLLMPATLIEEAALRRGIVLSGEDGDRDGFISRSSQYLRSYNRSVYLAEFEKNFARMVVTLQFAALPDAAQRLEQLIHPLVDGERRRLYLEIARIAVIKGASELARLAAGKAVELSTPDSKARLRAQVYLAAAGVVTEHRAEALEAFRSLKIHTLGPGDRAIVAAARKLAAEVERLPSGVGRGGAGPHGDTAVAAAEPGPDGEPEVFARARELFAEVDAMVKEVER